MISEEEREIITHYAKYQDIDLGVEGIKPELFFKFLAKLMRSLSKPVDLIDLSEKSLFHQIVKEKGLKIYTE